nr:MAG TPA: hypothetical protein [Caudoviricetes sp.]
MLAFSPNSSHSYGLLLSVFTILYPLYFMPFSPSFILIIPQKTKKSQLRLYTLCTIKIINNNKLQYLHYKMLLLKLLIITNNNIHITLCYY